MTGVEILHVGIPSSLVLVVGVEILKSMHVHATVAEHTGYAREGKRRARLGKLLLQRSTATVGMLYRFW